MLKRFIYVFIIYLSTASSVINAQVPHIVTTSPMQNEMNVNYATDITVVFDTDMDEATINSSTFIVYSNHIGRINGMISYTNSTWTAIFSPVTDFTIGDVITVILTTGITSSSSEPLENSYVYSFIIFVPDGGGIFIPAGSVPVADVPSSIATADFNLDGNIDLAAAHFHSDEVSVVFGNGDGTFNSPLVYPVGNNPASIVAGDYNKDGYIDLAIVNQASDNLSILLNNGDGSFSSETAIYIGDYPTFQSSADFDGDGDIDIVVSTYISSTIYILFNNGDGLFGSPVVVYQHNGNLWVPDAGDVDNDGDIDLAIPAGLEVLIFRNSGSSIFVGPEIVQIPEDPFSLRLADFDSDGDLDIATTHFYNKSLSMLVNNGDGNFMLQITHGTSIYPMFTDIGDFDADMDLDIAMGGDFLFDISVLYNNGGGVFPIEIVNSDLVAGPSSIVSADFDNDGDLDLASTTAGTNDIPLLLNDNIVCCLTNGDLDLSGTVDIADLVFFVEYSFNQCQQDCRPLCLGAADVDGNSAIDIADIVYLVEYMFWYGPPPVACS